MAKSGNFPGAPPGAPRLEPSTSRVGPIPFYVPGPVAPEVPPPELTPLDALTARLEAMKVECTERYLAARDSGFAVMGRAELVAINADLSEVRRLNAGLGHHRRSSLVAAWPEPVLPTNALLAPRDVLPLLRTALEIVGYAIAQAERERRFG